MARQGRRVAVVGATGNLGSEVVRTLEARDFPVDALLAVATDRSLGEAVELRDCEYPVETGEVSLAGLDVVFLCVPPDAAPEWVRRALHAEVPCVDLSGAFAAREEVPLVAADLLPPRELLMQPLVACPPGPALVWSLALAPIAALGGLRRVAVTSLEGASGHGREGVRALEAEVLALLRQDEPPDPAFLGPRAFDLVPGPGGGGEPFATPADDLALAGVVSRLLGDGAPIAITRICVPIFTGLGASLHFETERAISPGELQDALLKAPGVESWDPVRPGPTTRDAVGRDHVLAGRLRTDPSSPHGALLWVAADPVCIAASNAVRIAEARFDLH